MRFTYGMIYFLVIPWRVTAKMPYYSMFQHKQNSIK
jgi:hypothetical protein